MKKESGGGGGNSVSPTNVQLSGTIARGRKTYDTPRVPVVFVIGGPGSGKIVHSEKLARRRKGFVHINILDTLQKLLEQTGMSY